MTGTRAENNETENNRENRPAQSWSLQTINENDHLVVRRRKHKPSTGRVRGGNPGCCGSVSWDIIPMRQGRGFDSLSGRVQESTNEHMNKWKDISVSLSLKPMKEIFRRVRNVTLL